ncbi:hypothetical protein HN011_012434 [Eciton burchellii]|nr:hypothetical protein HN011_012434 [Eciton burchellii]
MEKKRREIDDNDDDDDDGGRDVYAIMKAFNLLFNFKSRDDRLSAIDDRFHGQRDDISDIMPLRINSFRLLLFSIPARLRTLTRNRPAETHRDVPLSLPPTSYTLHPSCGEGRSVIAPRLIVRCEPRSSEIIAEEEKSRVGSTIGFQRADIAQIGSTCLDVAINKTKRIQWIPRHASRFPNWREALAAS